MVDINQFPLTHTLNVNDLKTQVKEWNTGLKKRPNYMLPTRNALYIIKKSKVKVKRWQKMYHANTSQK